MEANKSPADRDWMKDARCEGLVDPEFMFPKDGVGVTAAQEVCRLCVVCVECLEYALKHRIMHGVWGGTSENERYRLLKQREQAD